MASTTFPTEPTWTRWSGRIGAVVRASLYPAAPTSVRPGPTKAHTAPESPSSRSTCSICASSGPGVAPAVGGSNAKEARTQIAMVTNFDDRTSSRGHADVASRVVLGSSVCGRIAMPCFVFREFGPPQYHILPHFMRLPTATKNGREAVAARP
ncbi:MAG TPA: hypothetical protein VF055_04395 [Steroidobacteraceae bacterium]